MKKRESMMKNYNKIIAMTFGATLALLAPAAIAQDNLVTLQSPDKNISVKGELVSVDDAFYVIKTVVGEMTVSRDLVTCEGVACPGAEPEAEADDRTVVLKSGDGTMFSGELLDFDGTNYTLKTVVGVLTIRSEFVTCEGASCPSEKAEEQVDRMVSLISGDGTRFTGTLQEYDGTNYVIQSEQGVLTVRSEFVTCVGDGCPDLGPVVAEFKIASPAGVGEQFIGKALNRFAEEKSLNVTRSISYDGTEVNYLLGNNSGELIASITVTPTDDIASLKALFSGEVAFALTREDFTAQEISLIVKMPVNDVMARLNAQTIALDALTATMNPANRVRSVSLQQMGDILSGRVTNWKHVGGDDGAIQLHVLNKDSNLARVIKRDILAPRGLRLSANVTVHETLDELNKAIADDPAGFAISYRSQNKGNAIPTTRNACNIFSSANSFSLQTEEYPLTMGWNLFTLQGQDVPGLSKSLAEYLSSNEGQAAAQEAGLVGLAIDKQPMSEQGERLLSAMLASSMDRAGINVYRNYLAEVSTADRLSTTLRFVSGSAKLDERALRDVRRISELVRNGSIDGNDILLVGFSDAVGVFNNNIGLSKARAERAKADILNSTIGILDAANVKTFGFGPVAPVGCNETLEGRQLNRRVEVWIRGSNQGKLR
ncbi:phosphate ABC transporter substrate-binding/OmpA family protein [Profundibacter sp.]